MSSGKTKKSKQHKSKFSDDLSAIENDKNIIDKDDYNDENDNNKNDHKRTHSSTRKRMRNHTKISHNKSNNSTNLVEQGKDEISKKVKFNKIDIIDVESWKELNLKMTAEENLDELLKLTEGRKERKKTVSCCIII